MFWRRKKPAKPVDPIAAYDRVLDDLESKGAQIRQSAATLLALRGDLQRDRDRNSGRVEEIRRRKAIAAEKGDAAAERLLGRDEVQAEQLVEAAKDALTHAATDAQLLLEAAQDISDRVADLRTERNGARARFAAGQVVSSVLLHEAERFQQVLALDQARDEVERAHQLAQIYREERKDKAS
jgi:phage shock protein A